MFPEEKQEEYNSGICTILHLEHFNHTEFDSFLCYDVPNKTLLDNLYQIDNAKVKMGKIIYNVKIIKH